ncbi:fasciclin domain-containing protein [Maribacter sp. HTCC2170]|uniref:fasciclin domain-containing protein n=1 Tax=Maribacter sp. (strain HTCC2170 / KCCM 42371) TaxID=313603 RepID=UPI0005A141DC|nr:fasciclin domain-containing protein [Maribacter sp. HTCC2170]
MKKKISYLFMFIAVSLFTYSCSEDDDQPVIEMEQETMNIVEAAQGTDALSNLVAALAKADESGSNDLIATLSDETGTFTVLAPTNDAFVDLLARLDGFDSLDDFNSEQLQDLLASILAYHVVSGASVTSGDLTEGQVITTVQGEELTVSLDGGASFMDAAGEYAMVTTADVATNNGTVHLIDKILLPQAALDALSDILLVSITDLAIATPGLENLVAALVAADGDLPTVLAGEGPFTVFAPTNDAFATFLADNNFAELGDVPVDVLTQVLLNHVVSGNNLSTDLMTGYISTLSTAGAGGNNLSMLVDTADGVSLNGCSTVTAADNKAINGVVHIVDAVIGLPNIVDHAVANSDLTELVGALTAGGNTTFTDLLSDDATDFTVFAPVNAAFSAFTNPMSNELNTILANHVIVGAAAFSSGLTNSYVSTAATNEDGDNLSMYINTDDGVSLNGSSNVAAADIVATNGVIHAVDAVIDLPTLVTFATADATFSPLVAALTEGTPDTDFVSVLNGEGPYTVFAPTDVAFQALLDSNMDWDGVTDIDEMLLTSVLNHHVANGNVRSGDLTDGMAPATLEGDNITINLPGTGDNIADITDGAGNTGIGVVVVDVQANNGVIHVVNQVMIPDTSN